jgi:pseudomonalisin
MFKFVSLLRLAVILAVPTVDVRMVAAVQTPAAVSTIAGSTSPAVNTLIKASAAPADQILFMRIVMSRVNRSELETLLANQQNPSSPQYHLWLRPGEFDTRFGPPAVNRTAISEWLQQQGFSISELSHDAFVISFHGTVQQAEKTFSVSIRSSDNGKHYANINNPSVPSRFAKTIGVVEGLDNLGSGQTTMQIVSGWPGTKGIYASSSAGDAPRVLPSVLYNGQIGFGPNDLYTFYDETPLLQKGINGAGGGCIGLIEVGDYDSQGVSNFDQIFHLPTAVITRVISKDSDNPGLNSRSNETMLDLLYAHAIAPQAQINLYLTDFNASPYQGNPITATVDSLKTAVDQDACSALSISIESCGFSPSFYTANLDTIYMKAAAQGQTVFVAEGDQGVAEFQPSSVPGQGCVTGTSPHVNELASDPLVTSVGGTQFSPTYDASSNDVGFVPESVWNEPQVAIQSNEGNGATGGGRSAYFLKPDFQLHGTPPDGARDVPDISMEAACSAPGVFAVFPTQSTGHSVACCACGTSLGAPIWAGITELLVQSNHNQGWIGTLNPRLYTLGNEQDTATTGIRDVVTGNNNFNGVEGFEAAPGYDLATGWGTPDINTFVQAYFNPQCVPVGGSCASGISCCAGPSPGEVNVCERDVCTPYRPPRSCNGLPPPPITCHGQWHCCGRDGWTCGLCR